MASREGKADLRGHNHFLRLFQTVDNLDHLFPHPFNEVLIGRLLCRVGAILELRTALIAMEGAIRRPRVEARNVHGGKGLFTERTDVTEGLDFL